MSYTMNKSGGCKCGSCPDGLCVGCSRGGELCLPNNPEQRTPSMLAQIGPREQRQNIYNNASGVRGLNYLCDLRGNCDGEATAQGGGITNSAQGRFAVDPTTIRPSDRLLPRGSSRMVDSLPDEDLHASASGDRRWWTPPHRGSAGGGRIIDRDPGGLSFDGSNRMFLDNDGGPTDLWFNQSGSNTITVGGDKYSFEPVLSWNSGCDTMDDIGDGIFTDQNCESRPGVGGVPGLGVSALRWKNGVMY